MARPISIRSELNALRAEFEALRTASAAAPPPPRTDTAPDEDRHGFEAQIHQLGALVEDMLAEAEDTVVTHPVATVAGAVALGIVIGRLTAR